MTVLKKVVCALPKQSFLVPIKYVLCRCFSVGCQPRRVVNGPQLNSRTYNIALETSGATCPLHRKLRAIERRYIRELKLSGAKKGAVTRPLRVLNTITPLRSVRRCQRDVNVYDFPSSDTVKYRVSVDPLIDTF